MLDEPEYSRWLASAEKNLSSARGDQERGDYNWACFKAQQAAELAAKALLHGIGKAAAGHSVSRLLMKFPSQLRPKPDLIEHAKQLDRLYIPTRYPNAVTEGSPHEYFTRRDGVEALKSAEAIILHIERVWESLRREARQGKLRSSAQSAGPQD